jgi:hypothetical protein
MLKRACASISRMSFGSLIIILRLNVPIGFPLLYPKIYQ